MKKGREGGMEEEWTILLLEMKMRCSAPKPHISMGNWQVLDRFHGYLFGDGSQSCGR